MRYKVFIVEDEIVVRESIRDNVDWESTNYILAGEAPDGEMALPLIQEIKPDILITDIKMPFMDGLTLSRIVKQSMPWIKIIIISGYDEFSFAKEAITISVTDYLLKPLSSTDLLNTLDNVASIIEEENKQRGRLEDLNKCLKEGRQIIAERFLSDLSTGLVPSAEAIQKAKTCGIDIVARNFATVICTLTSADEGTAAAEYYEFLKAEKIMRQIVEGNPDVLMFCRTVKENILIFKGDDPVEVDKSCHFLCHSLKYEIERKTECRLSVNIGGVKERIGGIAESLEEAETASRFRFVFGKNTIVNYDDTKRANCRPEGILSLDTGELSVLLHEGDRGVIGDVLDTYISRMESDGSGSIIRSFLVIDITLQAVKFVEKIGGDPNEVLPELFRLEDAIRSRESADVKQFLENLIGSAFDFRESCQKNRYGDIIERAKQYIAEHYGNPDLSLNEISNHVNVSSSHFSTIFSQETGNTFIGHLTDTRIGKAKEFLKTTGMRSSEIAYQVGYKDPHYFSYIFKVNTGKTPTEYRNGSKVQAP